MQEKREEVQKSPIGDRLLRPEEVAEILQVSRRTVVRWLKEGKLKGVRVGKLWRVRREDLEEFLAQGSWRGQ